jgi:hypothetical protein
MNQQILPKPPGQQHFPQSSQSSQRDLSCDLSPEFSFKSVLPLSSANLMKVCEVYGCVCQGWTVDSWSEALNSVRIQSRDWDSGR